MIPVQPALAEESPVGERRHQPKPADKRVGPSAEPSPEDLARGIEVFDGRPVAPHDLELVRSLEMPGIVVAAAP